MTQAQVGHFRRTAWHTGKKTSGQGSACHPHQKQAAKQRQQRGKQRGRNQQTPMRQHFAGHHRREVQTQGRANQNLSGLTHTRRTQQLGTGGIQHRHDDHRANHPGQWGTQMRKHSAGSYTDHHRHHRTNNFII